MGGNRGGEEDEESDKKSSKTCERWKDLSSAFPSLGVVGCW